MQTLFLLIYHFISFLNFQRNLKFKLRVFGNNTVLDVFNAQSFANRSQLKPSPSHQLLFNANQDDAFAVFQAIAAQVIKLFNSSFVNLQPNLR